MKERSEPIPGVRELDHTADVGIEATAPTLEELFHRAAVGMMAIVHGDDEELDGPAGLLEPPSEPGARVVEPGHVTVGLEEQLVELEASALDILLLRWLRELLYLDATEGFVYVSSNFSELGEHRLRAKVCGLRDTTPPVRELKGVTYHDLAVTREGRGWRARVIFDI